MSVGIITGTGLYELPIDDRIEVSYDTDFGSVLVHRGRLGGAEVVHVPRHGARHARLSHQTEPRATISALAAAGVSSIVATTIVGAVVPEIELGSLVVFDDLWFPSNRLPGGDLCTLFRTPTDSRRGHWIFGSPYADGVRDAVVRAAADLNLTTRPTGIYGHVDGPRLNSAPEISALARAGVTAVSQTGGPETVLAGEAEIPFALVGYVTDHANGVSQQPTPTAELERLMRASAPTFTSLLATATPLLGQPGPPAGFVYRFE